MYCKPFYYSCHCFLTVIFLIPGSALLTTPLAPLLVTFLPLRSLDTVLETNPNAFLGLFKTPFLPYEVDFFNAFIPLLTAELYALLRFGANGLRLTPTIGAFKSAIAEKVSLAPIPKSVKPCSNLILSILPRSSAASRSACPCGVCKAPNPSAVPAAIGKPAEPTIGAAAPTKLLPATPAVPKAPLAIMLPAL